MSRPERIPLFLTEEHQCSYLPDEVAQTAFVDPTLNISGPVYSSLNQQGFRRSGSYLYRPHCTHCDACKPLRVDVALFKPSRSQKRCIKKNENMEVRIKSETDIWTYYSLYSKYIEKRHPDGDMFPPAPEQFEGFLGDKSPFVRYVEFWDQNELLMVSVMDELADAISAIYTFYDPDFQDRGLGNFAILWQIGHAKMRYIQYLYLGYWIERCDKMNYKSKYHPSQILDDKRWQDF